MLYSRLGAVGVVGTVGLRMHAGGGGGGVDTVAHWACGCGGLGALWMWPRTWGYGKEGQCVL